MKTSIFRLPIILTIIVMILATIASAGGLFVNRLYQDNEFIKAVWEGNDIVTLFIVIPSMAVTLFFTVRNSIRAQLIWMGALWYMIYNYIFYTYGAAFNNFFLLYVLIFTISVYALILGLIRTDKLMRTKNIDPKMPVKWISFYMLFFAITIGSLWIIQSLSFVFTNEIPIGITQTDHPTGVVFATDLSFLVSTLIVGAVLLWKRNIWGYIISAITLTKCMLYPLVLAIGGTLAYKKTGTWDDLMPIYMILWVGCLIAFGFLIKGIDNKGLASD